VRRIWILALLLPAACEKAPVAASGFTVFASPTGGELVLLPSGIYMDRTEVTQELWTKVMGSNPSKRKDPKRPVEPVRWTEAVRFLNRCSEMDGLAPCYDVATGACNFDADGYRLPTETEWEAACRAGTKAKYSFGDDASSLGAHGWFKGNSGGQTHPVGQKPMNAFGLHDLHGNVWEWCQDWHADAPSGPRGPETGKQRVLRGGAWESTPEKCAADYRAKDFPAFTDACFGSDSYGFRRVKNATLPTGKPKPVAAEAPPREEPKPVVQAAPPPKGDASGFKGTIVFVSDRGGALDVWRMSANGKNPVRLTKDAAADADPKFSPDGKRILWTSMRSGSPEVWSMARDGSDAEKIAAGSQASWSPDGASIVLIRDNQAWTRALASGAEKRVTPEKWERCGVPAWSPDGKTVAVASRHEEEIGVYLVALDGSKEPVRLKTPDACCTPSWTRNGKSLLLQTVKGHIHQVDLDGKNWEQVTFGADIQHEARFSPDESAFVFCRAPVAAGPWQICIKKFDSDDFEFVQLTSEGSNQLPDWHPLED
jgi:WD40 repeat protein